jgi:hypothetical protein
MAKRSYGTGKLKAEKSSRAPSDVPASAPDNPPTPAPHAPARARSEDPQLSTNPEAAKQLPSWEELMSDATARPEAPAGSPGTTTDKGAKKDLWTDLSAGTTFTNVAIGKMLLGVVKLIHEALTEMTKWPGWKLTPAEEETWLNLLEPLGGFLAKKNLGLAMAVLAVLALEMMKVMAFVRWKKAGAAPTGASPGPAYTGNIPAGAMA